MPTITGVGMSNYSTPLIMNNWWSIYGSSLSTGSGSTVYLNFWTEVNDQDFMWEETLTNGNPSQESPYWYESSSQINFYAIWTGGTVAGPALIYVCSTYECGTSDSDIPYQAP
jgi:hypothetical protein